MTNLRQWYIATYADKFFTQPPAWFDLYMWMELVYHVPLSFWAVGALVRSKLLASPAGGETCLSSSRGPESPYPPAHLCSANCPDHGDLYSGLP